MITVLLALIQQQILNDIRITLLFGMFEYIRFNDVGFWFVIVRYFALHDNYVTLGL